MVNVKGLVEDLQQLAISVVECGRLFLFTTSMSVLVTFWQGSNPAVVTIIRPSGSNVADANAMDLALFTELCRARSLRATSATRPKQQPMAWRLLVYAC